MADSRIEPPVISTPTNWEEMEHTIASLQRWASELTRQMNAFRQPDTERFTASTPQMRVGQFDYALMNFFAEGSAVWTVEQADVERFYYVRIGQLMFIQFQLINTVVATDTSGSLFIRLYDLDVLPGRQQQSSNAAPYSYPGGSIDWSDGQAGTIGGGNVGIVGQTYDTSTRSIIIQLDRFIGNSADASLYAAWPISNDLDIMGSLWWITTPDTVPGNF